jgi:hypothetical protein
MPVIFLPLHFSYGVSKLSAIVSDPFFSLRTQRGSRIRRALLNSSKNRAKGREFLLPMRFALSLVALASDDLY